MFGNRKLGASFAVIALAAGCGGGSTSQSSYNGLQSELTGLFDDAESAPAFQPLDLPVTGGATYNGVMSLVLYEENLQVLGDLEVVADFTLNEESISATADNFSDNAGDTYAGQLEMPDGQILFDADIDTAGFFGDFGGVLSNNTTREQIVVDTLLIGDFYDENYEFVFGVVRGEITTAAGTLQINDGISREGLPFPDSFIDGNVIFLAERDDNAVPAPP